jgi:uncharacterized protein
MSLSLRTEVAAYEQGSGAAPARLASGSPTKHVWIDLDNSPHVPFFRPIIDELRHRGYSVVITARDAFQVSELTRLHGIHCTAIGRHYGKNRIMKGLGLLIRAAQLLPIAARERPDLAVSHGSRAQMMAARCLGIPSVLIVDYEHARHLTRAKCVIVPETIPAEAVKNLADRVANYPGIKEDVYVSSFEPSAGILEILGVRESEILVTVRPPATEAHYHNPQSEELFAAVMNKLGDAPRVRAVLLPRNDRQKVEIMGRWAERFQSGKMIIPENAVDGLNLIWHSDLVISGGGTMNREAAALGVPVYSIFRGAIGAVDKYLSRKGRLVLVETVDDVAHRVHIEKRARPKQAELGDRSALRAIVDRILAALST